MVSYAGCRRGAEKRESTAVMPRVAYCRSMQRTTEFAILLAVVTPPVRTSLENNVRGTGPKYAKCDYAGFWRRTAALIIDGVLLAVIGFLAPWAWYYLAPYEWVTERSYLWVGLGWWIFSAVYLLGFRMLECGTPGYRIVRIRYAYMRAGSPSAVFRLARALMAFVLLWCFALDHLWILFDSQKQAWHDKLTGFYVIKRRAEPIGTQEIVRRLINFMGFTFFVWEPVDAD